MKGLCGNYDENEVNDFQTPSGGALEATAKLFGDSWKLQPHCPLAQDTQVLFVNNVFEYCIDFRLNNNYFLGYL